MTGSHHTICSLLADPSVLRAAWMRIDEWYRSGNLAPQPELAEWRLDPYRHLNDLRRSLANDEWKPSRWQQVPHPKKGARLRHYLQPKVRDQVAFMAYIVLLGPLLDAVMPRFSFGNRWYQPILWDRRRSSPGWRLLRYELYSRRSYLPYARSHGLFRRVAHWTVARMTGSKVPETGEAGPIAHPDDYDDVLPEFVKSDWWAGEDKDGQACGYWAALDIQLAYPSVLLERLRGCLEEAVESPKSFDGSERELKQHKIFGAYPGNLVDALENSHVRVELARSLVDQLEKVEVDSFLVGGNRDAAEGREMWHPGHALATLPPENRGLPTGLAISGFLLNVVLLRLDRAVFDHLKEEKPAHRGAFLRFADDMILVSRSAEGLLRLIDAVWAGLCSDENARLATPESGTNLFLNHGKIGPDSVQRIVRKYLEDNGWSECGNCRTPEPPPTTEGSRTTTVEAWWKALDPKEKSDLQKELERDAVGREDLGPFVTTLVERLSEIARDTLSDRFGSGPRTRLVQLHELIRFQIDDRQVRPDTRLLFAANRLARTWLPGGIEEQRRAIEEIRKSIAEALDRAPWKVALWRAVVRAAARRPVMALALPENDREATAWLKDQLAKIAAHEQDSAALCKAQWSKVWPEEKSASPCRGKTGDDGSWRDFFLSYLRAAFWQEVARLNRLLAAHAKLLGDGELGDPGPPPTWWTVRAIPPGSEEAMTRWLCSFDKWIGVLYGDGTKLSAYPWELDALVEAVLSSTGREDLARCLWCAPPRKDLSSLGVPDGLEVLQVNPHLRELLEQHGRLFPQRKRGKKLTLHALAHIYLGGGTGTLGRYLFPDGSRTRLAPDAVTEPGHLAVIAHSLEITRHVPRSRVEGAVLEPNDLLDAARDDPFTLYEYHFARRIVIGFPAVAHTTSQGPPTLQRLLWGDATSEELATWALRPWDAPPVGLPVPVALALLASVRRPAAAAGSHADGPVTWALEDTRNNDLAAGRRAQLGLVEPAQGSASHRPARAMATASFGWEIPPHGAFFLPRLDGFKGLDPAFLRLWDDALLLFTACDGTESILDALLLRGPRAVPFEDRWAWRARIHFPRRLWRALETILRLQTKELPAAREELDKEILAAIPQDVHARDFLNRRIDLSLSPAGDDEIERVIRAMGAPAELPTELRLAEGKLGQDLVVRMGQISVNLFEDQKAFFRRFPKPDRAGAERLMAQVSAALQLPRYGAGDGDDPEIVLLPELCIPQTEVHTLREHSERFGRAYLAGLMWRVLRPPYPPGRGLSMTRRWVVNEAELGVPVGAGARGPTTVRWFRVRKPRPAHMENGFAEAFGKSHGITCTMLPGDRWYRFVHPSWGDFSVAICSDILDSAPWASLRGELLHLFMCAFNKDIDLFEGVTWVRAYEVYANLVSVNHGAYGGSFVWTPKHGHHREIARMRGNDLFVIGDVRLPVQDLLNAQRNGVQHAIDSATCDWLGHKSPEGKDAFKARPPGSSRNPKTLG